MKKGKKKKTAKWRKRLDREILRLIKEKAKTKRAGERLHRKAVKSRKKKVEKSLDRLLVGGCFLVCLAAALIEAKDARK